MAYKRLKAGTSYFIKSAGDVLIVSVTKSTRYNGSPAINWTIFARLDNWRLELNAYGKKELSISNQFEELDDVQEISPSEIHRKMILCLFYKNDKKPVVIK
jgi:hypothetical protein